MGYVKEIKANAFDAEARQAAQPVVVDFFATWCPPCKALAPILDKVAAAYAGKVAFVKVNTDEAQELAAEFGIRGIPTLVFLKGGQVVQSLTGLRGESEIRSAVDALL